MLPPGGHARGGLVLEAGVADVAAAPLGLAPDLPLRGHPAFRQLKVPDSQAVAVLVVVPLVEHRRKVELVAVVEAVVEGAAEAAADAVDVVLANLELRHVDGAVLLVPLRFDVVGAELVVVVASPAGDASVTELPRMCYETVTPLRSYGLSRASSGTARSGVKSRLL